MIRVGLSVAAVNIIKNNDLNDLNIEDNSSFPPPSSSSSCCWVEGKEYQTTNSGQMRQKFCDIPYAIRKKSFVLPELIDYEKHLPNHNNSDKSQAGQQQLPQPVNPSKNHAIPSQQGKALAEGMFDPPCQNDCNCMQLNIYRAPPPPSSSSVLNKKEEGRDCNSRRVVLFIHGGCMDLEYRDDWCSDPSEVLGWDYSDDFNLNTIWVNIDWSLGTYGFWYFPDLTPPDITLPQVNSPVNNLALHQLILGIAWIHRYIHCFGGNCKDITVFGQSSGAALAQYLHSALTPEVIQYYNLPDHPVQKYIVMSGSVFSFPVFTPEEALQRQKPFIKALLKEYSTGNNKEKEGGEGQQQQQQQQVEKVNEWLANPDKLINKLIMLGRKKLRKISVRHNLLWTPTIDGFLVKGKTSEEILTNPHYDTTVKILGSITSNESSMFLIQRKPDILQYGFEIFRELGFKELADLFIDKEDETISETIPGEDSYIKISYLVDDLLAVIPARKCQELYQSRGIPAIDNQFYIDIHEHFDPHLTSLIQSSTEENINSIINSFLHCFHFTCCCFHSLNRYCVYSLLRHCLPSCCSGMLYLCLYSGRFRETIYHFMESQIKELGSFHCSDLSVLFNWDLSHAGISLHVADFLCPDSIHCLIGPYIDFIMTGEAPTARRVRYPHEITSRLETLLTAKPLRQINLTASRDWILEVEEFHNLLEDEKSSIQSNNPYHWYHEEIFL